MEMNLKGTPAVIAAVIIIAVGMGYRLFLVNDLKDNPELRQRLEMHLMVEIAQGTLKRKITITDLAMRGGRKNMMVRADYTVFRPDGEDRKTGYYQFSHSPVTGWRYKRETTALSWYLKFF